MYGLGQWYTVNPSVRLVGGELTVSKVTYFTRMAARENKAEEAEETLRINFSNVQGEDGIVVFVLHRSTGNADEFPTMRPGRIKKLWTRESSAFRGVQEHVALPGRRGHRPPGTPNR